MKSLFAIGGLSALLLSGTSHAINPMNGWYAGLTLGGSYTIKDNLTFPAPGSCSTDASCTSTTGELSYAGFGSIGGQIGYRYNHFRLELEPLYNSSPYQDITVGSTKYVSPKSSSGLRLKGDTNTLFVMVNGYYDFFSPNSTSFFVPYLGIGIGFAGIENSLQFYCNNEAIACTRLSEKDSTTAAQGIVGLSYFLDEFAWFGLDYRYLTTNKIDLFDARQQIHTINLSISGIFNFA